MYSKVFFYKFILFIEIVELSIIFLEFFLKLLKIEIKKENFFKNRNYEERKVKRIRN